MPREIIVGQPTYLAITIDPADGNYNSFPYDAFNMEGFCSLYWEHTMQGENLADIVCVDSLNGNNPEGNGRCNWVQLEPFSGQGNALVSTFQKEADEEVVEKCTHSYCLLVCTLHVEKSDEISNISTRRALKFEMGGAAKVILSG